MKDALGSVQSVLVLGGGSEIARATGKKLAARAACASSARKPETLDATANELRAAGASEVVAIPFDATDFGSHEQFVHSTFDRFGDFDVVLLAFGVLGDQSRAEIDAAAAIRDRASELHWRRVGHDPAGATTRGTGPRVTRPARVSPANVHAGRTSCTAHPKRVPTFYQGLGDRLAGTGVHAMVVRPGFVTTKMTEGLTPAPLSTTPRPLPTPSCADWNAEHHGVGPARTAFRDVRPRHLPRPVFRRLNI